MKAKEVRGGHNERGGEGQRRQRLGRRRLREVDRGRHSQDGEIERLERWQDDKGWESEIKEQEAGEAAVARLGGKLSST